MENKHLEYAEKNIKQFAGEGYSPTNAEVIELIKVQTLLAIALELHRMNELTEFNVPMTERPE